MIFMEPLSRRQWEIMNIVWKRGEASALEIRKVLSRRKKISRNTARLILNRTEEKGWLQHHIAGRTFIFSPVLPREALIGLVVMDAVEDLCDGSVEAFFEALLEHRGFKKKEADRIRAMAKPTRKRAERKPVDADW